MKIIQKKKNIYKDSYKKDETFFRNHSNWNSWNDSVIVQIMNVW